MVSNGDVFLDIFGLHYLPDCWMQYHNLSEIYWSDRAIAKTLAYKKYREQLRLNSQYRKAQLDLCDTFLGSMIYLLLLLLGIGIDIYLRRKQLDAKNVTNMTERIIFDSKSIYRYATIEEIYDKLYEPSFRTFQSKQRPCRRYTGTYLESIRDGQDQAYNKKHQVRIVVTEKLRRLLRLSSVLVIWITQDIPWRRSIH